MRLLSRSSKVSVVVKALASLLCGPASILARRHMWVEFAVGSGLALKRFSHISNSNLT